MKYRNTIRFKIMLLVLVPLLFIAALFISVSLLTATKQLDDNNNSVSNATGQTLASIIETWRASTLTNAKIIASEPSEAMIAAIRSADTAAILSLAREDFAFTGCDGMTFTDTEGIALARLNAPEKYGDNAGSSLAIADAMKGLSVAYAYPTNNNGFSIVAGVPIVAQGEQIGTLFLSKRLDKTSTVDEMQHILGRDVIIYQYDQAVFSSTDMAGYGTLAPDIWQTLQRKEDYAAKMQLSGHTVMARYVPIEGRNGEVVGALFAARPMEQATWVYTMWAIIVAACAIVMVPPISMQIQKLAKAIREVAAQAEVLARGDTSVEIPKTRTDEIGVLQESMNHLVDAMRRQAEVIARIAQGDLTGSYRPLSEKDVVGNSLVTMLDSNNAMIADITMAASQVAGGAGQISNGAQLLAAGSTRQTETISALSMAAQRVHLQAQQTADLASRVNKDVQQTGLLMDESMGYMGKMSHSMQAIKASSNEISQVIKVIDDIAFQTNILALNAAVEAARAGSHGKGFAVVADEVRRLASKSAEAAQETSGLIQKSVEQVNNGAEISNRVNESMGHVVRLAASNSAAINEIYQAALGQREAMNQINAGIEDISQVVQGTSATAQQSAASAQELNAQSALLAQVVGSFRLRADMGRPTGPELPQLPWGSTY